MGVLVSINFFAEVLVVVNFFHESVGSGATNCKQFNVSCQKHFNNNNNDNNNNNNYYYYFLSLMNLFKCGFNTLCLTSLIISYQLIRDEI